MPTYEIDQYRVMMPSSRPTTDLNPNIAVAGIFLYQEGAFRGYAYFFHDGTLLAPPIVESINGQEYVYVHYNLSQLAGVLQMVREERPLYLYGYGPDNAGLATGSEPTGEEEGLSG
jgi:hypothetical protein